MAGVHPVFDPAHLYFVTTTATQHAHIFRRDSVKHIITDSFTYMRAHGWISLYAFAVMPNHVHFIARFAETHPVSAVMREFKKHTARQIINLLKAESNQAALDYLAQAASHIRGQQYKVWEDEYDARDVFTPDFLRQKTEYIHNNPCQHGWQLAAQPELYSWSSARYYLLDQPAIIEIDDMRPFMV